MHKDLLVKFSIDGFLSSTSQPLPSLSTTNTDLQAGLNDLTNVLNRLQNNAPSGMDSTLSALPGSVLPSSRSGH